MTNFDRGRAPAASGCAPEEEEEAGRSASNVGMNQVRAREACSHGRENTMYSQRLDPDVVAAQLGKSWCSRGEERKRKEPPKKKKGK